MRKKLDNSVGDAVRVWTQVLGIACAFAVVGCRSLPKLTPSESTFAKTQNAPTAVHRQAIADSVKALIEFRRCDLEVKGSVPMAAAQKRLKASLARLTGADGEITPRGLVAVRIALQSAVEAMGMVLEGLGRQDSVMQERGWQRFNLATLTLAEELRPIGLIGARLAVPTSISRRLYGLPIGAVEIREAMAGYPAYSAGIRRGDYILSIDHEQVNGLRSTVDLLHGILPGTRIAIGIKRQHKVMTFSVVVGQLKRGF